jgi:hypothetical protein
LRGARKDEKLNTIWKCPQGHENFAERQAR